MNRWECDHPGCSSIAIGVGSAVGLRAIGWFFERGPTCFCPDHRPDKTLYRTKLHGDGPQSEPCSVCKAELEAYEIQRYIAPDLASDPRSPDLDHGKKHPGEARPTVDEMRAELDALRREVNQHDWMIRTLEARRAGI